MPYMNKKNQAVFYTVRLRRNNITKHRSKTYIRFENLYNENLTVGYYVAPYKDNTCVRIYLV